MLLITPSEVIELAFIARETITVASIRTLKIDIAQEHFIRPRLGEELFDALMAGQYAELTQNYIKPALAQFVRYGMVDELAVSIGDRGALVYSASSGETVAQENKTLDTTGNQTKTTDGSQATLADKADTQTVLKKDVLGGSSQKSSTMPFPDIIDGNELHDQTSTINTTDTINRTENTTITSIGTNSIVETKKQIGAVNGLDSRSDEQFRPATRQELDILAQRAMSDGNILLAKAVRYIERHTDLYPTYAPRRIGSQIFINPWS
ncbi:MAG: hypothetical protein RR872_07465 [Mucinivorans sp.]